MTDYSDDMTLHTLWQSDTAAFDPMPVEEVSSQCGPSFEPEFLAKPFSVSDLTAKINHIAMAH